MEDGCLITKNMKLKEAILNLAEKERRILYRISNIPVKGLLPAGKLCTVEDPTEIITHGDVIHPCVRYIQDGFEGHQWWMVYTPWYGSDDKLENPRLCYADADMGKAPITWEYYCTIKECPKTGYNSDPTLLFHNGELYVFWRECDTPDAHAMNCHYATFGCTVQNKKVTYFNHPQLIQENRDKDNEVNPTFIPFDDRMIAYAMHQRLHPKFYSFLPSVIARNLYRPLELLNAFRLYSRTKCYGIAIWYGNSLEESFNYSKTIKIKKGSYLYNPWHMDLFRVKDNAFIYAVVQTNEKSPNICLAVSNDAEHFSFLKRPLITQNGIHTRGLYKSTAQVVDGKFHLYYTIKDNNDPSLNRLLVVSEDWNTILNTINK